MENKTRINVPTLNADDIIEKSALTRVQELDRLISNMLDSMAKASGGKNLAKYWKEQEVLINDAVQAYKEFNKSSNETNAANLIKVTNALKAVHGLDISDIIPDFKDFEKSLQFAQNVAKNLDSAFDVSSFKNAFELFDSLKGYGVDVQNIFNNLENSTKANKLVTDLNNANAVIDSLTSQLKEAQDKLEDSESGNGIKVIRQECEKLRNEIDKIREEATETFSAFLTINNLDPDSYAYIDFFERIRNGSLTAKEAIAEFKRDNSKLLDSNTSFDTTQLQDFSNRLDSVSKKIIDISNKLEDISSNGVKVDGSGTSGNLEELATIVEEISKVNASENTSDLYEALSKVLTVIKEIGQSDTDNLYNLYGTIRNLSGLNDLKINKASLDNLADCLERICKIENPSSLSSLSLIDLTKFNDLHISKASMNNLAEYLPKIADVNVEKLIELSKVNFSNFSDLKIDKAALDNLQKFTSGLREIFQQGDIKAGIGADKSNISSENITNQIVENEKKKQEAYKATTDAVMYHAGVVSKLNKAETNGRFYGSNRGTGYFGTGHYFVDGATKHELDNDSTYSKLPYTSIDISQYDNLFKATTDEIAGKLHRFLENLTKFTQGSDDYSVSELFSQFQKVFGETTMDMQEFDAKLEQLKTYMQNSSLYDRGDSVSTQFMKSLGYGGVDTRGTKYADTRYGTVIYDLKEESILQANITDELQKQGQMLEKINYEKGQAFDKSEDARIQDILNQQAQEKEIISEFEKIFDSSKLKSYEDELKSVNDTIKENEDIINDCRSEINNADEIAQKFIDDMYEIGLEMTEEEAKDFAKTSVISFQERIDELEEERPLLEARRLELEQNIESEYNLAKAAMERAKSIVEERNKPIEDVFQGGKIDQATTSAKELDKTLEQVDIPTDSFDDVLSKLDLTESKLKEIVKITKQSVSDSEGKFHDSYTLKDKRGSTEIYGLSSNTEKGQLLRSNIVGYDAKEIEQEAKALNQAWEEANKVNNALNETKNTLSSLPRMTELDTQFSSLDAKLSSLNSELTSGKISVADYKKEVKSLTSEYSKLVTIQQNRDVETYKQNAKATEQEAKAVKDAWDKNVKAIQDYMDAVTKLNNLKAQDKGTGKNSEDIARQEKEIESLKEKAIEARANISSMVDPHNGSLETWREYVRVMELFDQASQGSAESVAKLNDALRNEGKSNISDISDNIDFYQKKLEGFKIKPDEGHSFASWKKDIESLNSEIENYRKILESVKSKGGIIDDEDQAEIDKVKEKLDGLITTMTKTPAGKRGWTDLGATKTAEKIYSILERNTKMSKEARAQILAYYQEVRSGNPSAPLDEILDRCIKIEQKERDMRKAGKSWLEIFKSKKMYSFIGQMASMFSFYDIIRYTKEGINAVNEFDTGLTKISYTMDMTKSQLNDLGNSVLSMASDMKASVSDAMSVAQIYANMQTSPEEIKKLSEPTLILSNLSGFDSATIADDIQAVTQQFDMLAEDSMHIADVYDYISRNIAVDYSKFWSLYWKQYNENKSKSVKAKLIFFVISFRLERRFFVW